MDKEKKKTGNGAVNLYSFGRFSVCIRGKLNYYADESV